LCGKVSEFQKKTGLNTRKEQEKDAKMKQKPNLNAGNTVSNNNQPLNAGMLVGK
jgi:hypothetical protein